MMKKNITPFITMQLRELGKSNIKISPIILGTWAIGGWMWGGTDEKKAIEAIQASIENGITTIDTAPVYGMGLSEEIVGKAIQGKRDKVILATKCGLRWDENDKTIRSSNRDFKKNPVEIRRDLTPKSIIYECEQSMKRMNVDRIDIFQIHWPDPTTSIEESWSTMAQLKKEGKVRAIGVSNFSLDLLKTAHLIHPIDCIQPPYSLIRKGIEKDIIPYAQTHQISVIVYSPMERGLLTGKYKPGQTFPVGDHRADKKTFSPDYLRRIQDALSEILPIAEKHHVTVSQVIINCTIHRPGITAALIGARDANQAKENALATKLALTHQEREFIVKTLSDPELQCNLYED
jgi:aryl-alcohol dehydrogenase-like predicted oxidoreductase